MTASISKALLGITRGPKLRFHGRHTGLQGPRWRWNPMASSNYFTSAFTLVKSNEVGLG